MPNSIEVSFVFSEKAPSPIYVILSGNLILTSLSLNFPLNAFAPILEAVSVLGNSRSIPPGVVILAIIAEPLAVNPVTVPPDTARSSPVNCTGVEACAVIDSEELSENKEIFFGLSEFKGGVSREREPVTARAIARPPAIRLLKCFFIVHSPFTNNVSTKSEIYIKYHLYLYIAVKIVFCQ